MNNTSVKRENVFEKIKRKRQNTNFDVCLNGNIFLIKYFVRLETKRPKMKELGPYKQTLQISTHNSQKQKS